MREPNGSKVEPPLEDISALPVPVKPGYYYYFYYYYYYYYYYCYYYW